MGHLAHDPARADGYTLDLDSFSLSHAGGHQELVRVGYIRKGLKPCHRPIVAAIAEVAQVAHFWLRPGKTACVSGAATFLGDTLAGFPWAVRVPLVRADGGFCTNGMIAGTGETWAAVYSYGCSSCRIVARITFNCSTSQASRVPSSSVHQPVTCRP